MIFPAIDLKLPLKTIKTFMGMLSDPNPPQTP